MIQNHPGISVQRGEWSLFPRITFGQGTDSDSLGLCSAGKCFPCSKAFCSTQGVQQRRGMFEKGEGHGLRCPRSLNDRIKIKHSTPQGCCCYTSSLKYTLPQGKRVRQGKLLSLSPAGNRHISQSGLLTNLTHTRLTSWRACGPSAEDCPWLSRDACRKT